VLDVLVRRLRRQNRRRLRAEVDSNSARPPAIVSGSRDDAWPAARSPHAVVRATLALILLLLGAGLFLGDRDAGLAAFGRLRSYLRRKRSRVRPTDLEAEQYAGGGGADAGGRAPHSDRELFLFGRKWGPITRPRLTPDRRRRAAAATNGTVDAEHIISGRHPRRCTQSGSLEDRAGVRRGGGRPDRPNLREQYASLIGSSARRQLAALLLVAGGGFMLARQSTIPVERSMEQMRRFMADPRTNSARRSRFCVLEELALAQRGRPRVTPPRFRRSCGRLTLGGIVGDLLTVARADAGSGRWCARRCTWTNCLSGRRIGPSVGRAEKRSAGRRSFEEAQILVRGTGGSAWFLIVLDNAIKYTPRAGACD